MSKRKFKTLAAQITPEQMEKVRQEADKKYLTMSSLIRQMIDLYFSDDWLEFAKKKFGAE